MNERIEEGIQEGLLLEFPKRYYCIRGRNVNYTLLNLDVNIIAQYCRKSQITSPNVINNLHPILNLPSRPLNMSMLRIYLVNLFGKDNHQKENQTYYLAI